MKTINFCRTTGVPLAVALVCAPAAADVSVTVRILNSVSGGGTVASNLGSFQTVTKTDPRLISDLLQRDDTFSKSISSASADLGTGELKVNATGFQRMPYSNAQIAQATAGMTETLTIVGPGSNPIPVTFAMKVDGFHSTPAIGNGAGRASANVTGKIGINGVDETADLQLTTFYDANGAVNPTLGGLSGTNDWAGAAPLPGTSDQFLLELRYSTNLQPGVSFSFLNEIRATVTYLPSVGNAPLLASPIVADFGNTARLTIELPQDYSLTSQSGVFLAGPIPEPHHWALMLAGLGCVGWFTRSRARAS